MPFAKRTSLTTIHTHTHCTLCQTNKIHRNSISFGLCFERWVGLRVFQTQLTEWINANDHIHSISHRNRFFLFFFFFFFLLLLLPLHFNYSKNSNGIMNMIIQMRKSSNVRRVYIIYIFSFFFLFLLFFMLLYMCLHFVCFACQLMLIISQRLLHNLSRCVYLTLILQLC